MPALAAALGAAKLQVLAAAAVRNRLLGSLRAIQQKVATAAVLHEPVSLSSCKASIPPELISNRGGKMLPQSQTSWFRLLCMTPAESRK